VYDSFRQSANHYADSVKQSKDPLMGLIRDISGGAGDIGGKLFDRFTGNGSGGAGSAKAGSGERPSADASDPSTDSEPPSDQPPGKS
ncbi:MAG TPA: peptidase M48, partial [Streptomyces sp.]